MKKFMKFFILLIMFIPTIVFAESDLTLSNIKAENVTTGIKENVDNNRDFNYTFNDLNQEVKLVATIKNISNKAIKIDSISASNPSLDFMTYSIEGLNKNDIIEANEEKQVTLKMDTKQREDIVENFDENVYFNIKTKNKVESILENPKTGVISAIVFIVIWLCATTVLFIVFKNRRSKFYKINFIILLIGIFAVGNGINASGERVFTINGKVDYQSQNILETRYDNIEIRENGHNKPYYSLNTSNEKGMFALKDRIAAIAIVPYLPTEEELGEANIIDKYDMSKNQDGRVWAYVAKGPNDLYFVVICANGAIYLPENSAYYFSYLPSLSFLETEGLRTDYAKRMDNMFYSSSYSNLLGSSLELDLSDWNVSNVENMHGMFSNFIREDVDLDFVTIDLSNWDLKKCKNLSYMFEDMLYGERDAINVKIKFDNWDTSNVENFDGMFECFGRYRKDPELEINGWVINGSVHHMFMNFGAYSTGTAYLKLSNMTFNEGTELLMENGSGGNPEDMILDFENIKIKKTTKGMFRYVSTANPTTVEYYFSDWDTSEVTNMEGMFESDNFEYLDLTSFDTSNVTSMKNMFSGFSNNGVKVFVSDKWSNAKLPANEAIFGSNLYGCPSRTSYPLRDNEYATSGEDGCFVFSNTRIDTRK